LKLFDFVQKKAALFNWILKIFMVLLFLFLIRLEVLHNPNSVNILELLKTQLRSSNTLWLLFACLLVPVNWILETIKFRSLLPMQQKISFYTVFRSVMAGVTFSIFTPNRLGEYAGRLFFVNNTYRIRAVIATLVGSFAQQIILLGAGVLGFSIFLTSVIKIEKLYSVGIFIVAIAFILLMLISYFNIDLSLKVIKKIIGNNRFKNQLKHLKVLNFYTKERLTLGLMFAGLRYIVYSSQYFLVLLFFGAQLNIGQGIIGISTIYFLQTGIPLPPIVGMFARAELALKVLGTFMIASLTILSATFTLWTINLFLPSVLGMIFLLTINIIKTTKNES
jgi:uncharacterized membrane protein YbhN (UPF0104 family)